MVNNIPNLVLSNTNTHIPVIAFGTAEFPFGQDEQLVKNSVLDAIKIGYRHIDTAAVYQTEKPVGEAIAEALKLGLIKSREDLFITSKLFNKDCYPSRVLPALQKSLENLGLEYLDLYLIHSPVSLKEVSQVLFEPEEIEVMDMEFVWKAMEHCNSLGLAKAIGISNFTCYKIEKLLEFATIPPVVNQVEMNPCWQQKKLKKLCDEKGIHITAYSPLGGKGTPWGTNRVMECEVLKEIAIARGKTVAQVCMRWCYEQNVSIAVKSFNKERMQENLEIFDWQLSQEESQKIDEIPQERGCKFEFFVSKNGPFKSLMDLWDGEF